MKHICWLSGLWKGVAVDLTIVIQSSLVKEISENEAVLADKIYKNDRRTFVCPLSSHRYSLCDENNIFNFFVYSARQNVERMIKRVWNANLVKTVWKKKYSVLWKSSESSM